MKRGVLLVIDALARRAVDRNDDIVATLRSARYRFAGVARLRSSPAVKGRPARIVRRQTSVSDDAGVRFTDHRMSARRVVMFYRAMFGCGRSGASSTENDRGGKQNSCLGQHLRMSMMPAVPGCQMGTETSNAKSNWPA